MKSPIHIRILFGLSVLIPAGAFIANIKERHESVWQAAERRIDNVVETLQEHALKVFETQELALDLVEDIVRTTPRMDLPVSGTTQLRILESRLQQTVSIWITDAEGFVLAGSVDFTRGLNVSERDYFQAQRQADQPHFIGVRYIGRSTGQPSFSMSRRSPSADGTFNGTIHVAISPRYFEQYFRLADRGMRGAASLFRADGAMLARYPTEPFREKLEPESPVMRAIAVQPAGGRIDGVSSMDGQRRAYAYRRLADFGLYVGYGANMALHLAEWRSEALGRGLLTMAIIALLCGTTWLISRSLAQRQEALARLGAESELRQEMQRKLLEARSLESLGRMARGVAHDFNNLLTVMIGHLETLSLSADDPASKRALDGARKATQAGAKLAGSLLSYARTQVLQIETFQVKPFLHGLAPLLQQIATPERPILLHIAPDLPDCRADVVQLEACLGNLVANARDATEAGAAMELFATLMTLGPEDLSRSPDVRPGPFIAISVTDRGKGMADDTAARVFEPFFTTKADGGGSGLGLSQVFGLMQQLNGHIAIRTAPGEGTTVTLYLPTVTREAAAPEASLASGTVVADARRDASPGSSTAGGRILVVDDQPDVREVVEFILSRAGFSVVVAMGGGDALRILGEDSAFDLVLSDVVMPDDLDGISLVRQVHQKYPRLRTLLMSGYAPGMEALGDRRIMVVRKPFTRKVLLEAVESAMTDSEG